MKRSLFLIVLIAIIYSGTTLTSCKKSNGPTVASVTVLDTLGKPVNQAMVILWQDTAHNPITGVQSTLRVTAITNASGNAQFTFANEAFLNISATKTGYPDTAQGFIRLVQYQTTTATVQF